MKVGHLREVRREIALLKTTSGGSVSEKWTALGQYTDYQKQMLYSTDGDICAGVCKRSCPMRSNVSLPV